MSRTRVGEGASSLLVSHQRVVTIGLLLPFMGPLVAMVARASARHAIDRGQGGKKARAALLIADATVIFSVLETITLIVVFIYIMEGRT